MDTPHPTLAVVATGSEILNGEILERNGQYFSDALTDHGMNVVLHMTVGDSHTDILDALKFSGERADHIITIGGLGPTTDDITRNAISEYVNQPLEKDGATWAALEARLKKNLGRVDSTNEQQAFFPKGAVIFPNPHGTAPGFLITHLQKTIVALPGPPRECYPMFDRFALKALTRNISTLPPLYIWRVFGIPESKLGAIVSKISEKLGLDVAYRCHHPYIDLKLKLDRSDPVFLQFDDALKTTLDDYLLPDNQPDCFSALTAQLLETPTQLIFDLDDLTQGRLAAKISQVAANRADSITRVSLTGLENFWHGTASSGRERVAITMTSDQGLSYTRESDWLFLDDQLFLYALDWAANEIRKGLKYMACPAPA